MKMTKLRAFVAGGLLSVAALFALPYATKASIQMGGSIFPLTFVSQQNTNTTDAFNQMESLINQQVAPAPANPGFIVGFSTNQQFNPILQSTISNNVIGLINSSANTGANLISGISGRTIYPSNAVITAIGGNAASATTEQIVCEPSGRSVATFTIAGLLSAVPLSAFSSAATATPGLALTSGCASGDGVFLSNNGSNVTGAVSFTTNIPYIVQ